MRVLLVIDGSPHSYRAAQAVAARQLAPASEVRIITVVKPAMTPSTDSYSLPPGYYREVEKITCDYATKMLARVEATVRDGVNPDINITTEVLTGSPTQFIITEAEKWNADLIVVGSHGYSRWESVMLGSVSLGVAQAAKCSVEIVRMREEAKGQGYVGLIP